MLLYTIIPPEYIFEESDPETEQEAEFEIKRGSLSLLVQPLPGGQAKVSRIISTNAQDYLNPQWQPGSIMSIF